MLRECDHFPGFSSLAEIPIVYFGREWLQGPFPPFFVFVYRFGLTVLDAYSEKKNENPYSENKHKQIGTDPGDLESLITSSLFKCPYES